MVWVMPKQVVMPPYSPLTAKYLRVEVKLRKGSLKNK